MKEVFKIALRNLFRYRRRTLLTLSLIALGVGFVLVFVTVTGSFKQMMIANITDSFLGHIQIHRKGYLASIETLPLDMNLKPGAFQKAKREIAAAPAIEAHSPRVKFSGMFSNFVETTNIRLNGIDPEREMKTAPLLPARIKEGGKMVEKGEILVPELLAAGMKVKVGDPVVVIATNRDGSVNGKQFTVGGILESATGPGGRDGYIHMDDAMEILRMEEAEVSEVALRVGDFSQLQRVFAALDETLSKELNPMGKPIFEVHTWEKLSPFYNIARMIDVMTFFIKLMLIAIVLISIMNVMMMAVYERVREIGTMAAMGTLPGKILSMFVVEGLYLGLIGTALGSLLGGLAVLIINVSNISFEFGRQELVLSASLPLAELLVIGLIAVSASVLASLQPAFKASRMDPIEALGHV
jgi:putative ABC transport system permease protein